MSQPSFRVIAGTQALKERLGDLFTARQRGDVDTFVAGFAEDGVFQINGDNRLVPEAGPFVGRAAIAKGLRQLHSRYEYLDGLIVDIIADIDVAVVRRQVTVRSTATGAVGDFDVADHVRFRDGMMVRVTQYMDSASLAVLCGRI